VRNTFVLYSPQGSNEQELKVVLYRDLGVVRWFNVTGIERGAALSILRTAGCHELVPDGGEEDDLPAWFYKIDLVELHELVEEEARHGVRTGRAPRL
jgi:hypothetical protein